jgi:hypothetical protein
MFPAPAVVRRRVDDPDAEIPFKPQLTGEAGVCTELFGSQQEELVLRRPVDAPVFDADEAEAAGTVAPAPGADPDTRGVEDVAQGAPRGERDFTYAVVGTYGKCRHNKKTVQSSKFRVQSRKVNDMQPFVFYKRLTLNYEL